ncbi:single-stranded DNA-binding protein [Corynebacterium lizhenjunii]|uniref:single-stranded DNA-binding protein n=1 Tax=Corynebacterium lizhenjunii TaxID=2709394 RepID=UPI0013ECF2BE|nr:single-stranded DNA-binding protein [Corynebacterium lizhenjunii]
MSQLPVTLTGHLATDPHLTRVKNGNYKLSMRLASSRRYTTNDEHQGLQWHDADQLFVDVEAWGKLAENVRRSLKKGLPVIVVGSLNTASWNEGDNRRSRPYIRATHIGPDLNRFLVGTLKVDHNHVPDGVDMPDPMATIVDRDLTAKSADASDPSADVSATAAATGTGTQGLGEGASADSGAHGTQPPDAGHLDKALVGAGQANPPF